MKKAIVLFLVVLFSSCTPQQRLERIIKRNPNLVITQDTTIQDTTILPETIHDTIFSAGVGDTVRIISGDITTIFVQMSPDSFYIQTVELADTIIKPITVPQKQLASNIGLKNPVWNWQSFSLGFIGGLLFSLLLLYLKSKV